MKDRHDQYRHPIVFVLAFLSIFLLSMFVGVSVLVGAAHLAPSAAALAMLIPAAAIGVAGATFPPTRKQFSRWYIGLGG